MMVIVVVSGTIVLLHSGGRVPLGKVLYGRQQQVTARAMQFRILENPEEAGHIPSRARRTV